LHPGLCMHYFEKNWDHNYVSKAKSVILQLMTHYRNSGLVDLSGTVLQVPALTRVPAYVAYGRRQSIDTSNSDSDDDDDDHNYTSTASRSHNNLTVEQEYGKYILGDALPLDTNLLYFWEMNRRETPTLFHMAMDFLAIQASSVPSERVFSSAAETDTSRRNRIRPLLMEALQTIKFSIRQESCADFTSEYRVMRAEELEIAPSPLDTQHLVNQLVSSSNKEEHNKAMDEILKIVNM
ncbi:hypothetical protein H0H92_013636, partial [Tricholoma furcatifolium]